MFTSRELLPFGVLAGGLYLGFGRLKNLREGQGCPKCEAAIAFALAAWAGWEAWQQYRNGW